MGCKFSQDGIYKRGTENFGEETYQKSSTWKIKKEMEKNFTMDFGSLTCLCLKQKKNTF